MGRIAREVRYESLKARQKLYPDREAIEGFFPKNGVRYIIVNDAVDTDRDGSYDMTPFRAVMNQVYSADVSKKVHLAYATKARTGQFTGCLASFGYRKDDSGVS